MGANDHELAGDIAWGHMGFSYVESMVGLIEGEVEALLLDPQTAGGLLVAITPESLTPCLNELRGKGFIKIARVGRVREGAGITLLS